MTQQTDTPKKRITRESSKPHVYPFSAIVGQAELKLGLLLNVIAPSIGGVLVMGIGARENPSLSARWPNCFHPSQKCADVFTVVIRRLKTISAPIAGRGSLRLEN